MAKMLSKNATSSQATKSENRPKQPGRRRAPRSAFKPGQSGNPGGRPKIAADVKALAGEYTTQAVQQLARIMTTGVSESSRIAAARELLDRACGKPAQVLTGSEGGPVQVENIAGLSNDQLAARLMAAVELLKAS